LREGMNMLAGAIGLPAGGYLATTAFGWTALTAAAVLLALAGVVLFLLREKPVAREEARM
jgi:predicted MFS family arabinose efflux permease